MSFVYRHDAVNSLIIGMKNASGSVSNGLTSVQTASGNITSRADWKGNKADSVKNYLSNVHGAIIASIGLLMKDIYDQAILYQKVYNEIDGDPHAVVSENDITELSTKLTDMTPVFDSLSADAAHVLNTVSYIRSITYPGIDVFTNSLTNIANKLNTLCSDISGNESAYASQFEIDRTMISNIKALLVEARSMNLESFSAEALANNKAYRDLAVSYMALESQIQSNAEQVELAETYFQETYAVLEAEFEERKAKAEKAKFWTGLVTAVGSAIFIAATGGAGIAVVAAVGAVSGAINAGVGSYFDQQVGTVGCPGTVDFKQVIGASVFGGAVGAATSCIGFGASSLSSGAGFLESVAIEGVKSVATGAVERAGDACYDSIRAGEPVLDVLENTFNSAFDPKKMGKDLATGVVGGMISQGTKLISGKVEDKLFPKVSGQNDYDLAGQVIKAPTPSLGENIYSVVKSSAKDTVTGIGKRFIGEMIETGDISESLDSAFDLKKMTTDAAYSAASSTGAMIGQEINTANQQKKLDLIQEKINEESRAFNERNKAVCEAEGIERDESGHPLFDNIADVEIEETFVDPDALKEKNTDLSIEDAAKKADSRQRYQDGKNAYDKAVESGMLDKDTYKCTGTSVVNVKTGEKYTWDHGTYDVNTGNVRMRLVPREQHEGIRHQGGDAQIRSAYLEHNVGEELKKYNNEDRNAHANAEKSAIKSSGKVTYDYEDSPELPDSTEQLPEFIGFQFLQEG